MSLFRTLEPSDPMLTPDGLHFITVRSAAMQQRADITIFVPRQAAGLRDVPMVLLLHGVDGLHWAWAFKGGAHHTVQLDVLMAESRAGWSDTAVDLSVLAALLSAPTPLPPLRFDGGRDGPFIAANRRLQADLDAAGIAHEYAEHDGGHSWDYGALHLQATLHFFGLALKKRRTTN